MTGRPDYRLKPKVEKVCDVCNKTFITSFSNWKRCSRECSRIHWKTDYIRYQHPYGITLADYNRMFNEQNGCCYICKRHQTEINHKLNVDHCHKTDKVRSLLCNQCNQALGLVREDPEVIQAMLEYVSW